MVAAISFMRPDAVELSYVGRHSLNSSQATFDWVGSGLAIALSEARKNEMIAVDMDAGGTARFSVFAAGMEDALMDFEASAGRQVYMIPAPTTAVTLIKTSEPWSSRQPPTSVFGVALPPGRRSALPPSPLLSASRRTLDFYGDSDSAGFGIEGSPTTDEDCAVAPWKFENWAEGWVRGVQRLLEVDEVRVQAISGIGVVKNAGGRITGPPLPAYLRRTHQTVASDDYRPADFRPSAIVMYLGSNDYTAQPLGPPSKAAFMSGYANLTDAVLSLYALSSAPPVVHVCGGEPIPCDYIEELVQRRGEVYTPTGDAGVPKGGCLQHRNTTQQAALAKRLAPVIASAARWPTSIRW